MFNCLYLYLRTAAIVSSFPQTLTELLSTVCCL